MPNALRTARRIRRRLAVASGVLGFALAGCASQPTAHASQATAAPATAPATAKARTAAAPTAVPASPRTTAQGRTTRPPWPAPDDASGRAAAAGLPMLGAEGQVLHIHAHLDVLVDGRPVTVPALIGIDERAQRISPLHTHDTSGVIHIESPVRASFTLGQFMTEWDVALAADRLGGLTTGGGNRLTAYVNGHAAKGDPAALVLRAHDEIALVYGPASKKVTVPEHFDWPEGL